MGIYKEQEKYERWWLGKSVRTAGSNKPFRKVAGIRLVGPRSFVYGNVWLNFEGDKKEIWYLVPQHGFKARKKDIEVEHVS